jgi:hypothetical protein
MGRYLLQLIALLMVAVVGVGIYWRVGTSTPGPVAAPAAQSQQQGALVAAGATGAPIVVSWPGSKAQYLGRYHLVSASDQSLAQSGELTIFMRAHVPHEPKPVLSGILSLNGTDGTNVFYLTHFQHQGLKRWARVNLGIYTGPMIGEFVVTSLAGDRLVAQLTQQGQAPIALSFMRFSHNPQP